jgi:phospholipase C
MEQARLLVVALLMTGCSPDEGPRSSLSASQAAQLRRACTFKAGATAGLTLAKDARLGDQIPVNTIVMLMMENRSFDHILGQLPQFGQPDVDAAPASASNPDSSGKTVARFHNPSLCFWDTNHEFAASHRQFNDGANDGFVITNEGNHGGPADGTRAMSYYDATDVPWLYSVANAYAISDRHFASVMGPTFPNREYFYAGTSYGQTDNNVLSNRANIMTLIDAHNTALKREDVSWAIYYDGLAGLEIFADTFFMNFDHTWPTSRFFADAAAGKLPNVVFLDPNLRDEWGGGDDDHPPGDVQVADQFMAKVVQSVTASPQWPHLALIITFDEHGGLYDHAAPPKACAPDGILPIVPPGETQYDFAQYGFRVPLIVISPYAKAHYVSHAITDHTSITRFVEQRFKLPAMSARDANADPLSDLFDFTKPGLIKAPSLPTPTVDPTLLQNCQNAYPLHPVTLPAPDAGAPPDMM